MSSLSATAAELAALLPHVGDCGREGKLNVILYLDFARLLAATREPVRPGGSLAVARRAAASQATLVKPLGFDASNAKATLQAARDIILAARKVSFQFGQGRDHIWACASLSGTCLSDHFAKEWHLSLVLFSTQT